MEDTSHTVLDELEFRAEVDVNNVTIIGLKWGEYAEWNECHVEWSFPSDFVIHEGDGFGTGFKTNYSESREVNVSVSRWMNNTEFNSSGYQLVKFNVTFENTDFKWCWGDIIAHEHWEVEASIVPGSFRTDAPIEDIGKWEHGVHFDFDKERIEPGKVYNFSVVIEIDLTGNRAPPIIYKPRFKICEGFYHESEVGGEELTVELPADMLPDNVTNISAATNVSNYWLIKRHDHVIMELEEVSGSTRIEAWIFDAYLNPLPAMPNTTFSSGAHENYKFVLSKLENPTSTRVLSPSILLETQKPVMDYDYEGVINKFSYDFVAENASNFNWTLSDISPHEEGIETELILSEMDSVDYGYNASVSVDKFEFSSPSEQTLNITIDVYDNTSMEILFFETYTPDFDFVSADFTDWSSDIPPEYFEHWGAHWWIENPEKRRYTFSIKVSVTPYSQCIYRPGVEIVELNITDELVNSSSGIVEHTWAGNYTISTGELRDWVVYKGNASVSSFSTIAAENYTTISGYVKDDNGNPIENTMVFVERWKDGEYQGYVETSTNENGYYEAYVKSNEKYKIVAGWTRPDYTTEVVEDVTALPFTKNFTLYNASVVCGGVFDVNSQSLQGLKVGVVNETGVTISSDGTNEDGYYRQLKIPEYGNYTVNVEGYDSNELELSDVGKGKAILHNFVVEMELPSMFDTGPSKNPYPSISGIHNGTIKPNQTITVSKLYTYPCAGTGGHSEYMKIWNETLEIETMPWEGYKGDWHTLSFLSTFTLVAGETYNYTIRTGSYPQIHHTDDLEVASGAGKITCDKFVDANGKEHNDWIPAIKLE